MLNIILFSFPYHPAAAQIVIRLMFLPRVLLQRWLAIPLDNMLRIHQGFFPLATDVVFTELG